MSSVVPTIVLDTNVCLDLLLFRDPAVTTVARALEAGELQAVTDVDCRAEWLRVLGYPQFALDEATRQRLQADYDSRFRLIDRTSDGSNPAALPRCADPDDQKFLELACRNGASWLLSRDLPLLALARRMRRDCGLVILEPRAWVEGVRLGTISAVEDRQLRLSGGMHR